MTASGMTARMWRMAVITALGWMVSALSAGPEAQVRVEDDGPVAAPAEVRFRSGDLSLGGLFFVPPGVGPFPAAVFIRGSGPSSRDNYWARSLVDVFVERRIAVLLPDKRGSDASEGDWRSADFGDLAADAVAGVNFVRARPEVDRDRVGLVGLSQGGRIAPIAASASDAVAFVVNIVGAAAGLREQVSWEMYHTFREAGVEGAALQDALALQVLAEGYVEGRVEWHSYNVARLAALSGPMEEVARGFPATQDAWEWTFFRSILNSDPIPYWRNVTQPVLVLYGENDHNTPTVQSAYRLIRVWREIDHPDATLRIIPDTGHGLWQPDGDPHRPRLHSRAVAVLGEWVTTRSQPSSGGSSRGTTLPAPSDEIPRTVGSVSSDQFAGWYRIAPAEEILVSFASDRNLLIYHFGEPPYANRLERNESGALVWRRGEGKRDRIVKFSSDGSERRALQWREDEGPWNRAEGVAGPYEVVESRFRSHDVTLSATVFVPSRSGPHPGVVFIHGSGASTRDNFWYVWIADRLARHGIAVLLPDKRGTGKSGGDWEIASFHDFAADAAAGVAALGQIESVAPGRIGALGVSQGGHIAPMVPDLASDLAFVVNLSGSAVPIEEQLRLELTNTLREEGWPRFLIPLARPVAIRVVKNRRPVWWEKNGKLDPIPYWSRLGVPALIVYGAEDEQDNVPVRRSVERLRKADREDSRQQFEIIVYPDSGHALYAPGTHRIREDFLRTLVHWIHETTNP